MAHVRGGQEAEDALGGVVGQELAVGQPQTDHARWQDLADGLDRNLRGKWDARDSRQNGLIASEVAASN